MSRGTSCGTVVAALAVAGCFSDAGEREGQGGAPSSGSAGQSSSAGTGEGGASGGPGGSATAGQAAAASGGTTAGAGGTGACSSAPSCGGDVVGTWTVTSSCLEVRGGVSVVGFGLGCATAPVTGFLSVSGSFTANADGTYSDHTTTSGAVQIEFPEACFSVGWVVTCDHVANVVLGHHGYASATCVAADEGCLCDATVEQTSGMALVSAEPAASGTYESAGDILTLNDRGLLAAEYTYCVSSNELSLRPLTDTAGTLRGAVLLTKR